jgi:hypothetical protein
VAVDPRQEDERRQLLGREAGEGGLWAEDDNSGWDRLSIRFNSRQSGGAPVRPDDLLLPSGLGNLRMFGSCVGMSAISTVLYVWFPLMLINFFVEVRGLVMASILVGAFLAMTIGLYLWGSIETQRDRELGARL